MTTQQSNTGPVRAPTPPRPWRTQKGPTIVDVVQFVWRSSKVRRMWWRPRRETRKTAEMLQTPRRVALEQGYPHNQECMSTSATSGRHMASRTINCKRRRARACACVRVHGRETCMCAGVNVHVRLAASGFIWPGVYINKQVAIAAREHPLRYFKGKSDIEGRPLTQLPEQRAMPTLRKRQGTKDTKTCWHQGHWRQILLLFI